MQSSIRLAGLLAGLLAAPLAHAATPVTTAGPVNLIAQVIIPAGSANGSVLIRVIPKGFYLVIQSASYFRSNVAAGSVGNLFLQTKVRQTEGYVGLPEAVADGSTYPSGTLAATIYCTAGTSLVANAYRSGSTAAQETENILIVGTYVQDPAS